MAHNLNKVNGKTSIFTTAATWHREENKVSKVSSSEVVINDAGLNFSVEKFPLTANGIEVPNFFATMRTDTKQPLGIVGNRYEVLQNAQAFKFIDDVVGSKQAIYHSAGALGNGETIWLCCKLPNQIVIGKEDVAEHYFFLTNSHNGKGSIEIGFSETFIVCENTLKMALSNGKRKQSIRHTTNFEAKMFDSAKFMGITFDRIKNLEATYKAMTKVKITDKQLREFIKMAINPAKEQIGEDEMSTRFGNIVNGIEAYAHTDATQNIISRKGNLFGAFNAVTGYYNNVVKYDDGQDKLKSIMYGSVATNQTNAFNLAVSVLEKSTKLS